MKTHNNPSKAIILVRMENYEENVPEEFEEYEEYEEYEEFDDGEDYVSDTDYDTPEKFPDDDDEYRMWKACRHYRVSAYRAPRPAFSQMQLDARTQLIIERREFLKSILGNLPPGYFELFEDEPAMAAINARVAENERAFMARIQPGVFEDDGMGNVEMVQIIPKKSLK